MDTMLNLSGGLDSVYAMYVYLTGNNDKNLLVHHIVMPRADNIRWEIERDAVSKTLDWFNKNGMSNFVYRESIFDLGDVNNRPLDSVIVGFITSVLLRDPRYHSIKYLINTTPKDEYHRLGSHLDRRRRMTSVIRQEVFKDNFRLADCRRPVESLYYLKSMMKGDIIASTPQELIDVAWSCRNPTKDRQACNRCHTCIQINRAKRSL